MNTLKARRAELNLTQKQVAQEVGIAYQQYQAYESGRKVPKAYLAVKLAKALQTTVEALFPVKDE